VVRRVRELRAASRRAVTELVVGRPHDRRKLPEYHVQLRLALGQGLVRSVELDALPPQLLELRGELRPLRVDAAAKPLLLERVIYRATQRRCVQRPLDEVVLCTLLHRLDRHLLVSLTGQHDDADSALDEFHDEVDAVSIRQSIVE
jgi:hypothetical protein